MFVDVVEGYLNVGSGGGWCVFVDGDGLVYE